MTKHKILVVEPDEDIRNMLDSYFTNLGYEVMIFPNYVGVFDFVRIDETDVLILDRDIPEFHAVIKMLKRDEITKVIPIFFLTQKDERSDMLTSIELGADDYVTKPFDIEELKIRIENAINQG